MDIRKKSKVKLGQPVEKIYKAEWIVALLILVGFTLLYNQYWDMELTIYQGKDFLQCLFSGKVLDFYGITLEKALAGEYGAQAASMGANYNIVLYAVMGVLIFPFYLLEKLLRFTCNMKLLVVYINVFVALLVVWSGMLLKNLVVAMGITEKKGSLISFLYLTSLMTLVSTVGFCQLDIIYMLVVLISLKWYLEEKYHKFSLGISFAISLKYFPILMFIPLILLVEKDVKKLLIYMIEGAALPAMFFLVYGRTEAYHVTKQAMEERYFFVGRLFENGIDLFWNGKFLFFLGVMVLICIITYDYNTTKEERWKFVIMIPLLTTVSFSILVLTHTQWYIMMCPFIAMALGTNITRRSMPWLEIVFSTLSSFVFALTYFNNGILAIIFHREVTQSVIFQQIIDSEKYMDVKTTLFTITIGYFVLRWSRDVMKEDIEAQNTESAIVTRGQLWIRMAIAAFNMILLGYAWLRGI